MRNNPREMRIVAIVMLILVLSITIQVMPSHVQAYTLSPLKQIKSGVNVKNIKCNDDLHLVIKKENGSPACVKVDTSKVLLERGWARSVFYNIDLYVQPRLMLDTYYDGINKNNATVSINNKTYYQTTLDHDVNNLTKGISILFQKVIFVFPNGIINTSTGRFLVLDIKFPDGSEEIYGRNTTNPVGSNVTDGIEIPSPFGPPAITSITALSNHLSPQAGITIFHNKIKVFVSAENKTSQ
ncbi:MAG: hypothetical protein LV477_01670 [Candidatus Nitrosotalea sp.]|nr:hypothetical protein [Candidatus Nitrosotalea sp.]